MLVEPDERGDEHLVGRDGEVIRPELDEPLDERLIGLDRAPVPLVDLLEVVLARELSELLDRVRADAGRRRRAAVAAGRGRGLLRLAGALLRLRRRLTHGLEVAELAEHQRGLGRARLSRRRAFGGGDLALEPAFRVGADRGRIARPRAEPEAIGGNCRVLCEHDCALALETTRK